VLFKHRAVSKNNMADVRILKVRVGLKTNQGPEVAYGNKYDLLYIYIYMYNVYS